jgi:Tfp pilus assembly protein PilN
MRLRNHIILKSLESSPYLQELQNESKLQQKGIDQLKEQQSTLEKEIEGIYDSCFDK